MPKSLSPCSASPAILSSQAATSAGEYFGLARPAKQIDRHVRRWWRKAAGPAGWHCRRRAAAACRCKDRARRPRRSADWYTSHTRASGWRPRADARWSAAAAPGWRMTAPVPPRAAPVAELALTANGARHRAWHRDCRAAVPTAGSSPRTCASRSGLDRRCRHRRCARRDGRSLRGP